jgi:hypothetical protein
VENHCLGTRDTLLVKGLNEKKIRMPKRYFSINESKRNDVFFGTETENRNEINIFSKRNGTKQNETKKKLRFIRAIPRQLDQTMAPMVMDLSDYFLQ